MKPRTTLVVVAAAFQLLFTINAFSQAANPSYLREMPSEERVLREIKGADPIDTAARQSGAFEQLRKIIYDLALVERRDRNHVLPDEKKVADYYEAAAARAWQRVQAGLGPSRQRIFELTKYATNPDFTVELLDKFFSPDFRSLYAKADATFAARHEQFMRDQKKSQMAPVGAGASGDPGTLAMRRCVAAGRDPLQCMGEVVSASMKTMAGGDAGMGSAFGQTLPSGLRMTGRYGDGHFFLSFTEDHLWVTCNHVATESNYMVTMNDSQVVIAITPGLEGAKLGNKPFSLNFVPDGNIVGTGTVKITAMVPAPGYTPQTKETRRRYISEEEAKHAPYWENPQRDAGGNPYVDEPIASGGPMVSQTATCQLGTNRPLGSVGPTHGAQTLNSIFGSMSASAPWGQRSAKDKAWPGPGLRLYGEWDGQGGLSLDFHEDSVVLGCAQTFLASNYAIRTSSSQAFVTIENGGNPVTLALGPGRSLVGSESITVTGHEFVGDRSNANASMFAVARSTCHSGTLNPTK